MHAHMDKYEVKGLLGKAATGSGYLASDPFGQREVAIKVLDQMPNDPEEARRQLKFFQNEASLAGKLRHPHIVSIYDAGIDKKDGKDLRYQVMELVEGMSLQPDCESKKLLAVSRAVQIAYKCCKALDYANGAGVGSPAHRSPGADPWRRGDRLPLRHVLAGRGAVPGPYRRASLRRRLRRSGATCPRRSTSVTPAGRISSGHWSRCCPRRTPPSPACRMWRSSTPCGACLCRKVLAGTDLIREGQPDDHIYVLAAGMLKVNQRGKLLNAVSPGECVGEMVYAWRSSAPRFSEAFLAVMAERVSMMGGRLLALIQEQNVGLV